MKKPFDSGVITSLALLLAPSCLYAEENQLIDDYWMKRAPPATESRRSSGPERSTAVTPRAPVPARAVAPPAPAPAPLDGNLIPAVQGPPPDPGGEIVYRIAAGDQLRVQVFQVPELSSEERVSDRGEIVMSLIGPVPVAGLTAQEAEDRIAAILAKDYLQDPQVDVYITESTRQQVTVMGAVKKPGMFPVAGRTTLLQVIALAEGTDSLAKESEVIVFRTGEAGSMTGYVIDLSAVKKGVQRDPVLLGEDRVVVPQSGTAVFVKGLTDTLRGFVRPMY